MDRRTIPLNRQFLKHDADADDVSDVPVWRMGLSMSTTWSWGITIAIGFAIMHGRGILPFIVWVVPNVLAIPFFGVLRTKLSSLRYWPRWTPWLLLLVFVELFAIVLNLKFIQEALGGGADIPTHAFLSPGMREIAVIGIGLIVVLYIHRKGFRGSIITDTGQYIVQVGGVLSIIVVGLIYGTQADVQWLTMEGDTFWWLRISFIAMLFAILTHGQQWQRMESFTDDRDRIIASLYGGAFFGLYMVLVSIAGLLFDGSLLLSIIFFIIVLAVATSSIDSAVAALQWLLETLGGKRYWGSLLAIAAVFGWRAIMQSSATAVWQVFADIRWKLVAVGLALTLLYSATRSDRLNTLLHRYNVILPGHTLDDD